MRRQSCSVCGRDGYVRADGGVQVHWTGTGRYRDAVCPGSGRPPGKTWPTEQAAAEALLKLIHEIEAAGYPVSVDEGMDRKYCLNVGTFTFLDAPEMRLQVWKLGVET